MSLTKEDIKDVVNGVLDERRGEDLDHKAHHAFVEALMRREERKREMWEKIKTQVLGWGIIAIVGGIGSWVLHHWSK